MTRGFLGEHLACVHVLMRGVIVAPIVYFTLVMKATVTLQ